MSEDNDAIRLFVEDKAVGRVIGKHGRRVQDIQISTNSNIVSGEKVTEDARSGRIFVIRGSSNSRNEAVTQIRDIAFNAAAFVKEIWPQGNRDTNSPASNRQYSSSNNNWELADTLESPQHAVGYILREKGKFLKSIESQTDTKISATPKDATPPAYFTIRGKTQQNIDAAKAKLQTEIQRADPLKSKHIASQDFLREPITQFIKNAERLRGQEKQEIALLLLGKSGVGKSTFVNGLVNYLRFQSLDDAVSGNPLWAMKMKFTHYEGDEAKEILVAPQGAQQDKNEQYDSDKVGASVTQQPRTYTFPITDKLSIKLIDTPGIGDTNGLERDNSNFRAIMDHLADFAQIHGILILVKTNDNRDDVMFKYCIKGLLEQLHRSAIQNILFCLTNSQTNQFKPGSVVSILKQNLAEYNVEVVVDQNVFCFENDCIRFLAEEANSIRHERSEKDDATKSWRHSSESSGKLFQRLLKIGPHDTGDTMSVNRARLMIAALTEPLADVSAKIELNIKLLEDRKKEIRSNPMKLATLANIQLVGIEKEQLDYPQTVCGASDCIDAEKGETIYKTICHDHCYLRGIPTGSYPQEGLRNCATMEDSHSATPHCRLCKCAYSSHLHVCYKIHRKYHTLNVAGNVDEACQQIDKLIDEYRQSRDRFANASSKLVHFLMENAIVPYNDAVENYLTYLIKLEESNVRKKGSGDDLAALKNALKSHKERKEMFEKALAQRAGKKAISQGKEKMTSLPVVNVDDVKLEEVEMLFMDLQNDKCFGQSFKELYDIKYKAERKLRSETPICHNVFLGLSFGRRFQQPM